ncbi:unnamed protein product [Rotaria sordida]|uniref:Uncharacterized protein n=3 Tax=Rotaria sordida TaxID=392033 RepID=A0A815KKX7_9BILA|nr:unnamed protein product [Rotaria sordida]
MMNLIEDSKEEISEEYYQFSTQEEIRLDALKEQAIILSGKISEHCHLFRARLRNGQVLGYTDIIAKLYYDIPYANYKYYSQSFVKDNLLSVKKYLEKFVQQFSNEQQITDKINIEMTYP